MVADRKKCVSLDAKKCLFAVNAKQINEKS
jgi:hypothetical protein